MNLEGKVTDNRIGWYGQVLIINKARIPNKVSKIKAKKRTTKTKMEIKIGTTG
jgi:hypothetical protein